MAPLDPQPATPRSRRRPFIATSSPDELLGQIIQTLRPKYAIDAPHLVALRKVLASSITAPKNPPRLVRTRPDRRIGEMVPILEAPRRSPYGCNGPPVSCERSFYFHHEDPDFERTLPAVDRARYVRVAEGHQEGIQGGAETLISPVESIASSGPRMVAAAVSPGHETRCLQESSQMMPLHTSVAVTDSISTLDTASEPTKDSVLLPSPPASTTSSADCSKPPTLNQPNNTSAPTPMLPSLLEVDTQDTQTLPDTQLSTQPTQQSETFSPPLASGIYTLHTPPTQDTQPTQQSQIFGPPLTSTPNIQCIPYTQDTQPSTQPTQQSQVFSLPVDFLPCTPPTQESSQGPALLEELPAFTSLQSSSWSDVPTAGSADTKAGGGKRLRLDVGSDADSGSDSKSNSSSDLNFDSGEADDTTPRKKVRI